MAIQPKNEETITFDTLKRLIGVGQARQIWAQKQVAEVGVLYDVEALEAMRRIIAKEHLPTMQDIRLAAPAMAAYWREAYERTRNAAHNWIGIRLRGQIKPAQLVTATEAQPTVSTTRSERKPQVFAFTRAMRAEREAAFAQGMGFCPNHPPGERVKPRAEFTLNKLGPSGLSWRCRQCDHTRMRKLWEKTQQQRQRQSPADRVVLLRGERLAERAEAYAQGLSYCPNHPTKAERIQPVENFYADHGTSRGLTYRCKACMDAYNSGRRRPQQPNAGRKAGLLKARAIIERARELEAGGVDHTTAIATAREWWHTHHNGQDRNPVADLPPLPEDSERPYEEEPSEPVLVTANAEEVR